MPSVFQKIVEYPAVVAMNFFTAILAGGLLVDGEVKKNPGCRRDSFYQSVFDLFRPSKTIIHHPHFFAKYLEEIEHKRLAEIKSVQASGDDLSKLEERVAAINYPIYDEKNIA